MNVLWESNRGSTFLLCLFSHLETHRRKSVTFRLRSFTHLRILVNVNSNSTVTQSEPEQDDGDIMTTTLSVPRELWKRVKIAAAMHDTTAQKLCADGLELRLAELAKPKKK